VQDCVPESNARTCNYVQVDNITMKNSVLGVYFRYTCTNLNSENIAIPNKGVSVTNCSFYNMRSTAWDNELAAGTTDNIGILNRAKGNLPYINDSWQYVSSGGGAYEYFYAAAIMIGGKPKRVPQGNAVVSDINIKNIYGENCNVIVQSHGYFLEPEFNWEHTKNWRIENVYGVESGLFTLDNVTGGWDGTDQST
jgi:hypothetical protein